MRLRRGGYPSRRQSRKRGLTPSVPKPPLGTVHPRVGGPLRTLIRFRIPALGRLIETAFCLNPPTRLQRRYNQTGKRPDWGSARTPTPSRPATGTRTQTGTCRPRSSIPQSGTMCSLNRAEFRVGKLDLEPGTSGERNRSGSPAPSAKRPECLLVDRRTPEALSCGRIRFLTRHETDRIHPHRFRPSRTLSRR